MWPVERYIFSSSLPLSFAYTPAMVVERARVVVVFRLRAARLQPFFLVNSLFLSFFVRSESCQFGDGRMDGRMDERMDG